MSLLLPNAAVIRVARGNFDPARYAEVVRMFEVTGAYLVPAIKRLPGMLSYHAGIARSGLATHVSLWQSEAMAEQVSHLREITGDARSAAAAVGAKMLPTVNYPVVWSILPEPPQPAPHGADRSPPHKVGAHRP